MKKRVLIILFVAVSGFCSGQIKPVDLGFYSLANVNGEVTLKGLYRQKTSVINGFREEQESTHLIGDIKLNTRSHIWDPKFLILDINGAYSPENRDERYLVMPERSEVRTMKKLDATAKFYSEKNLSFSAHGSINESFQNRENLTNIKANNKQWGANLYSKYKFLPFSIRYNEGIWDQLETETGRQFTSEQRNIEAKATRSFTPLDKHELIMGRDELTRQNANLYQTTSNVNRAELNSNVFFDHFQKTNLISRISWFDQTGTNTMTRIQAMENFNMQLPKSFYFKGHYRYYNINQQIHTLQQHNAKALFGHKVDKDLNTRVYYEFNSNNHTLYQQTSNKAGADIRYQKRIPTGRVVVSYNYYRYMQNHISDPVSVTILDEEQILQDGSIVLLERQYADIATVVVTDQTGTLIYDEGIDYLLIERNSYIEIQRIAGGLIPNGGIVQIDYATNQPSSYSYDANNHSAAASVFLFDRILEVYFRTAIQDYVNVERSDFLTLNRFNQYIYGARVNVGFASAGVEYDDYQSNLIPYKMVRYFLNAQKTFNKRFMISALGNLRQYNLVNEGITQQFADASCRFGYRIKGQTKINLEAGYRNQQGEGIDLNMITGRVEFTSVVRQFFVTAGVELFNRDYLTEEINFNGAYLQLTRKF